MFCSSCGATNPEGAKFCMECGRPTDTVCAHCGSQLPDEAKFCMECGSAVAAEVPEEHPGSESAAGEERRLVSVLFADLVGFTPFTESRDSEDVRAMLTAYFERAAEVIERFGGLVEKYIGDAIMAVWGADSAEEDDAERAVRAALEIVDGVSALGEELGVPELDARVGVLTGEATVGTGGNRSTGMIVGDVVNTAARLQSVADPGAVLVGQTTQSLTASSIDYSPAGETALKGKSEPIATYRAHRVVTSRRGGGRKSGIEPPFVGRDREFRLLKEVLHSASTGLQLVSIVGEPGIGKSRITSELLKYIDGLADLYYWHAGRCPSYGDGVTFWALAEMVRQRARIAETDTPDKSLMLLRTMLTEYVTDAADRAWLEPRLAGLLGLAAMPTTDRAELFAAWRTLFERIADRGPTVMVFEDLHWADDGMLDFIDVLATTAARSPIIVLTLARPDLLDRRPRWGSGHRHAMSMRLGQLSDEAMGELIRGAAPFLDAETVTSIVERAAGVPLFAVEFIRMAATGQALEADALPDSLQAMIGARIDRLDSELRSLVHDAAILGMSFTVDGLSALREEPTHELETLMARLVGADLFEFDSDPRSPERGQYKFVQSVIREVAHSRLSRRDRVDRHMAVARYLEGLSEPSLAAVVASHYLDAHRAAGDEERGVIAEAAIASLDDAMGRAAALHSHGQVLSLFEQAQPLLSGSDLLRLMDRAARSAGLLDEARYLEMARQALDMAIEWGSPDEVLTAATLMARALNDVHRNREARDELADLVSDISTIETPTQAYAVAELARALMLVSDAAAALDLSNRAMEAGEYLDLSDIVSDAFTTSGTAAIMLGRALYGRALLKAGVELSEQHDHWSVAWRANNNLISTESIYDLPVAVDLAERSTDRSLRIGVMREAMVGLGWLTLFATRIGQPERASRFIERIDETALSDDDAARFEHIRTMHEAVLGHEPYAEPPTPDRRGVQRDAAQYSNVGAFLNRDFERVIAIARHGAELWEWSLGTLAGWFLVAEAALLARDAVTLEEINQTFSTDLPLGTASGNLASWALVEAYQAALAGDEGSVVSKLEEAVAHAAAAHFPFGPALGAACLAEVLGTSNPRLRQHVQHAREFFDDSGLAGFSDVFRGVFESMPSEQSA